MPSQKPGPRFLTVKDACRLTPNMIRVTFAGEALRDFPTGREGANCKLMLPEAGESPDAFRDRFATGPFPVKRTYTIRRHRPSELEIDIDFVDHGEGGPASAWARRATAGSFLAFAGPGPQKIKEFQADYHIVAADPSAIPVAAATLEAMPRDAVGIALFEITEPSDAQDIDAPAGVDVRWMIHPDPHRPSTAQIEALRALPWPEGRIQACVAGEHSVIQDMRRFLLVEKQVPREDAYIAGYWKIGLVEDQHQALKRGEPSQIDKNQAQTPPGP